MIAVEVEGRRVWIRPWLYVHACPVGQKVPILLLDTDLDQNAPADRELTHYLYGGDEAYRLKQEIVLGIGGIRLLRALGFDLRTCRMNEGHAALLTIDLLNQWYIPPEDRAPGEPAFDIAEVRERCVFTTHTSVAAGHDRFSCGLFAEILPDFVDLDTLRRLAGNGMLDMTQLAFNLSGCINGVARRHTETTEHMFPGYRIHSVTNGVHAGTWAHPAIAGLFDWSFPRWQHEPEILVRALPLSEDNLWQYHEEAKSALIARANALTGVSPDPVVEQMAAPAAAA